MRLKLHDGAGSCQGVLSGFVKVFPVPVPVVAKGRVLLGLVVEDVLVVLGGLGLPGSALARGNIIAPPCEAPAVFQFVSVCFSMLGMV